MNNKVQLITYADRLGTAGLRHLHSLLEGPFQGLFGGVHLLPFFHPIDGADAGFDPIDHTQVDPRLGGWEDLRELGEIAEITADLIVNHVSVQSPQFQDYLRNADASPYAGMFLTFDRVFPQGASEADLVRIYRPRPGLPFTSVQLWNGRQRLAWTTFTPQQVDIDVLSTQGAAYIRAILERFRDSGVRLIRLDAVGYAIKKPGTSCFMIPETFDYIDILTRQAHSLDIEVLVEIHSYYRDQVEIARRVDRVYDFALPPLVLHTLFEKNARALKEWLSISPRNSVTVLDTHDGIGVIDIGADSRDESSRPGLLPPSEIDKLVETIHRRSGGQSREATGAAASNLDLYQVNCTFYDALGGSEDEYLIARAIQFFAPGVPQVYYVGLLAGSNDMELLRRTGVGREINRHYYTPAEIAAALEQPVVRKLVELIRFRNQHLAFSGEFHLPSCSDTELILQWRNGPEQATLSVYLDDCSAVIRHSTPAGEKVWVLTTARARSGQPEGVR
jgi:sucrose phosphorylase